MSPAIRTDNLVRRFGELDAVAGVSLEVDERAIFGLLGPDGAGKTTLIRMLATVLAPSDGRAAVFGHDVVAQAAQVTPLIGYMPQRFCLYPDLSVSENLEFFATVRGVGRRDRRDRAERLLAGMGLAEFKERQAQFLSGGMKQKLMLASTLMHEPDLLLLDEPTTGVDPVSRREFWTILGDLHSAGKTIVVATPYMDEAARCTSLAFIDGGKIRQSGTPQQITERVPGTLVEVLGDATSSRAALATLGDHPDTVSAHLHGDVARVLWRTPDAVAQVGSALQAAGLNLSVRPAPIDMEAAFTFLAETESREAASA
ncbi:MAG TPA: ABC transporter ATP-binding protein [Marmoricola sp.]|nr:ABC transporter ATP-binding protein [Marmoricola sp.]